jgi:GTPase
MDSGKSTLVAVLTHGADGRPLLDNGRGSARMAVFRHKHEIESGRTSSISQQVGAAPSGLCDDVLHICHQHTDSAT